MTEHRDYVGAKMGMWLFLFTEILLFGGLFVLYSVTLGRYPTEFHEASKLLDVTMGTTNTVVLITSSLFAALSVAALQKGSRKTAEIFIGLTMALACCFLVIKYFEWSHKIHAGIYPGGETLVQWEPGKQAFFSLYYTMTGLHGLHVIIGMGVFTWVWAMIRLERCTPDHFVALENAGLYWHLVDLIWIYLFPLYYLIT
ncbi:cytochrome c oxidase subunit 3 family protein [Pseudodesulfovibrio indicus]|uniref:cytochrome c oxidase subunit 3 family protein n=1 Tax=Pseudodesulfovibrio indicus TaxID=1716143 RepID=UPI00292D3FD6|nr:cytochrome c oxidase subunit 3 family protein [Pseudodesulfovibrio indicus]